MASAVGSSNHVASSQCNILPKFHDYRTRVMLGDLPSDFLRIQLVEAQVYGPSVFGQELEHDSNFLGHFALTIVEAKLIKNSGPLGLITMDPYVRFQIGSLAHETATGGGKNPQWNTTYRINLYKGMERIHMEVFDQRSFTEDSFIGECYIEIPQEVITGQTKRVWYPLYGRGLDIDETQGEILVIMSLATVILGQPTDMDDVNLLNSSSGSSSTSSQSNSIIGSAAMYSADDIRTIEEMFPAIDRQVIIDLFEKHGGNKDLVVNYLLQNVVS